MKSKVLKINGLRLKLYTWGDPKKPMILFCHGWLDTGASFDFICPELSKQFYCVSFDMRGYGKSEHNQSPLGYFRFEYIADLHELIQKLSPQKAIYLCGHSLGGMVSSIYAGIYPEKVKKFINMEGFFFRDLKRSKSPEKIRHWMENLKTKKFRIHKNWDSFAKRLQKTHPHLTDKKAIFLAKHLGKKTKDGVMMAADPRHKVVEPYGFSREDFFSFWKKITAPTLLLWGDQTEFQKEIPNFKSELVVRKKAYPKGTKIIKIKNCGHMMHHYESTELTKVIRSFFEAV